MKREFTHSELSTYQSCPQMWYYRYNQRLSPVTQAEPLRFGGLIHDALAVYGKTKDMVQALQQFSEAMNRHAETLADPEQQDEHAQSASVGVSMLSMYREFSGNDNFETIEVEQEHTVPVVAPSGNKSTLFEYTFRPDAILRRNGKLWLKEYKTASIVSSDFIANLVLDEQVSRYCWAYERYSGEKVEGVIYDILRKAVPREPELLKKGGLSQNRALDTTYARYLAAVRRYGLNPADYAEILAILKAKENTFIRREEVLRNAKETEQCERRLWTLCKAINTEPPIYKCPSQACSWLCCFRILCIEDSVEARSLFTVRANYHPELDNDKKTK